MLGTITFAVDGRSYEAAFTNSAMRKYEERFDESFLRCADRFDEDQVSNLRLTFLFDVWSIAVHAKNPDLSQEDLSKLADGMDAKQMMMIVGDALRAAFPDSAETGGKKTKPVQSKKAPPKA